LLLDFHDDPTVDIPCEIYGSYPDKSIADVDDRHHAHDTSSS